MYSLRQLPSSRMYTPSSRDLERGLLHLLHGPLRLRRRRLKFMRCWIFLIAAHIIGMSWAHYTQDVSPMIFIWIGIVAGSEYGIDHTLKNVEKLIRRVTNGKIAFHAKRYCSYDAT